MDHIDIGISTEGRQALAEGLSALLADTYLLYLKTHGFHWNVTGPQFQPLHLLFEQHYTDLQAAVDPIAERIRALGVLAPASYRELAALTSIEEAEGRLSADEMVRQLVSGQETVIRTARRVLSVAQEAGDEVTAGLLTERMQIHEKNAWMLRSILG